MENVSFGLEVSDLFFSDKYDITKHKNYSLLEDYDKKNRFNVERCIKRRGRAKLNGEIMVTLIK